MEGECRLMGEHAGPVGPQPYDNEILVLAGREMNESVHATTYLDHALIAQVLGKQLRGVPSLGRLGGSEVALLGGCCFVKPIPVWSLLGLDSLDHSTQILTQQKNKPWVYFGETPCLLVGSPRRDAGSRR